MIFSQNYFKIRVLGMTSYLHLSYHTTTRVWKSGGVGGGGGGANPKVTSRNVECE